MKKYLILFFLVLSSSSFAQDKLILGFDAGSLFAGEHMTNTPSGLQYSYSPDYLFGIEAGYGFSETFGLRMQIFIDQRTITSHQTFTRFGGDSALTQTYTIHNQTSTQYLEIPITAKYNFFTGRTHGYFFGGPVIAFNIDNDAASKTNIGFVGGIGYSRDLTHTITFFAESGFTLGFHNLSGDYWNKTFSRDFRVNAGLLFNIGLPIEIDY